MTSSLVGSEMCIRDRDRNTHPLPAACDDLVSGGLQTMPDQHYLTGGEAQPADLLHVAPQDPLHAVGVDLGFGGQPQKPCLT
eukprot:8207027-Prorocentrum_lima.AAC.1